ncbi:MAG: DUF2520 domain-containing protein [Gammaproteobacteria bacterium]|nr:DUF2520 domain-containing protein [Gammaproteobacteria bacterium]
MPSQPLSLNIVGCGKLGQTLGYLWQKNQVFHIQNICNTHIESARQACVFIGTGRACEQEALQTADVWLIATPDEQIAQTCTDIVHANRINAGNIVFHCSGALTSAELTTAQQAGAYTASLHPIMSFSETEQAPRGFQGTFCGYEGDSPALKVLTPSFTRIGAQCFPVSAEHKVLYHTAAVFASNYLTALLEQSLRTYEKAGIPRHTATKILRPIMTQTLSTALEQGTHQALTGPIQRGDVETVAKQVEACQQWDPSAADLYSILGHLTVSLAKKRKDLDPSLLTEISARLNSKTTG